MAKKSKSNAKQQFSDEIAGPYPMSAESKRYRAESDLRTLTTADEIRKDRERSELCRKHAHEQHEAAKKALGRMSHKNDKTVK